jgi:hypothetical protein
LHITVHTSSLDRSSSPKSLNAILRQNFVAAQHGQALLQCLRHEQAVEGVPVMIWQVSETVGVDECHRESAERIVVALSTKRLSLLDKVMLTAWRG